SFVIDGDLLDAHRRRQPVKWEAPRINDVHTVGTSEPDPPIRRLRGDRTNGASNRPTRRAISTVEVRGLNHPCRVAAAIIPRRDPRVELRAQNTHYPTGHHQPERTVVVLEHRLDVLARQTISGGDGRRVAVLEPAQALFGGGPERAVRLELETVDVCRRQSVRARIRGSHLTIDDVRNSAASHEPQPHSSAAWIGNDALRKSSTDRGPGKLGDGPALG